MQNNLLIDIPNFKPIYVKNTNYSYDNKIGSGNLKDLLTKTSDGHCMYCFSKILVDRKNYGHLEHSIEKSNSEMLKNCVPNLSIACPTCNQSFKSKGQKERLLEKKK